MSLIRKVFDYRGAPLLASVFLMLFIAEGKRQLRARVQSRTKRVVINSVLALPAFALLRLALIPLMVKLARWNERKGFKFFPFLGSDNLLSQVIAFMVLDYSNYLWHVLNHKLPFLWRFHLVHHCDHDLDVSTATRFHFGELFGSLLFRGAWVMISGASARTVLHYEIVFEAATQFHHSNMKMPIKLERKLGNVLVTPRMHGIHHSMVRNETDSNYSVIFSFWDKLHRTLRLNVSQEQIVIGVPSYKNADELTIGYLLMLPFTKIRKWDDT